MTENIETPGLVQRPVPVEDVDSAPFWEACREHRLTVQECVSCGQQRFPPVPVCHRCRSREQRWVELDAGTVYSWVVVHYSPIEAFQAQVPYVVAVIELADGVRMPTQLLDVEPEDVVAGMEVVVAWQDIAGGQSLPLFRPRPVG